MATILWSQHASGGDWNFVTVEEMSERAIVKERVSVFGLGYVGSVSAACLASLGHEVVGVDRDELKVQSILRGEAPFYEPGLQDLVQTGVASGRLTATTSVRKAVEASEVALICVGTPSERNGNIGLDQLRHVAEEIAEVLHGSSRSFLVAIRSTVFPGTCEHVVAPALASCPQVKIVSNPEFLREGIAVKDFFEPSLLVVGGTEEPPVRRVADLYAALPVKACTVSLRTAEMIKYACNCFHAVKIAFANEIGTLAANIGADPQEVMGTLCQDTKLNVSTAYLSPGFAFGGSCLPKDLRALVYRGSRMDLKLPLLESSLPSNEEHLRRATQRVLELKAECIGIYGLSFKENTDDLRESPVIHMLETLIGKGRKVCIFDPHIRLDAIYGSNRNYVLNAIPHIGRLLESSLDGLLANAGHIVVTQKPSVEVAAAIEASGLPVVNLYRM